MSLADKITALATRVGAEIKSIKSDLAALGEGGGDDVKAGDFIEFMGRTYGVVESAGGRLWLDRNLGASRVATASDDEDAYGDLYQWGRFADGHQQRGSDTTETQATSNDTGHGKFITVNGDWRDPQNNNLWQAGTRINLPAPIGWRLPTENEWNNERLSWSASSRVGAFNSPLKLPAAGERNRTAGVIESVGSFGRYWSATVAGTHTRVLILGSAFAYFDQTTRTYGYSVRLIKD